jgi:hypothetical protein
MITVDDASGIAIALARGRRYRVRPAKAELIRDAGVLAGILAGPFFLVSVGLKPGSALITSISLAGNSWAVSRFRGRARWLAAPTVGPRLRRQVKGELGHDLHPGQ